MLRLLLVPMLLLVPAFDLAAAVEGSDYGRVPFHDADGNLVVPLGAPPPAWLTPEIVAKTKAAADVGLVFNVLRDAPERPQANAKIIRPGVMMVSPWLCTVGFFIGSSGSYSFTSAGHCSHAGDDVVLLVSPGVLVAVGTTSAHLDQGIGQDWSVTPIRAEWQRYADPGVLLLGGPTGTYDGSASLGSPVAVKHIGYPVPRAGVSTLMTDRAFFFAGAAIEGDSGSPVLTATGAAVGVLTHLILGTTYDLAGTRSIAMPGPVVDGNPLPT